MEPEGKFYVCNQGRGCEYSDKECTIVGVGVRVFRGATLIGCEQGYKEKPECLATKITNEIENKCLGINRFQLDKIWVILKEYLKDKE